MKKQLEINGQTIAYIDEGEGKSLLFLHGWGCDSSIFNGLFANLRGKRRIIMPDFPGFGESPIPNTVWSVNEYAICISDFLKKINVDSVDIVAHSFGGRVALCLSQSLVQKQLLTGAAGVPFKLPFWKKTLKPWIRPTKKLLQLLKTPGAHIEKHILKFYADSDYLTAGPLVDIYKKVVAEDLTSKISSITAPTLLIFGKEDKATPLYQAQVLHEKIQNSELVVFEHAGHYAFLDQQEKFLLHLKRFFEI